MGEWLLSRRDSTIVARHEVPGIMRKIAPSQAGRLKRSQLRAAMAHERELFVQQRATELAKANEVLRLSPAFSIQTRPYLKPSQDFQVLRPLAS